MFYYFNTETSEIIAKDAADAEQKGVPFTTQEELAASKVTLTEMLKWLNSDKTGEFKIKKLDNKADGAKRIFYELGHLDEAEQAALADADAAKAAAAPASPAAATGAEAPAAAPTPAKAPKAEGEAGARGRKSKFEGKTISSAIAANQEGVVVNPRRADTHGFRSLQLVIDAKAITYEDYIAKGGRNNDLTWDIDHKYVTVA